MNQSKFVDDVIEKVLDVVNVDTEYLEHDCVLESFVVYVDADTASTYQCDEGYYMLTIERSYNNGLLRDTVDVFPVARKETVIHEWVRV